jgi:DNA (cytosine-5)-methyltransferase 1
MTKFKEWEIGAIDLLVGGTPCQSFSVAGLRKGLEDPRGNLALVYCGILDRFKPKWFVWENVPGVLSSSGGRDFGSFLGAVAELGYGFAYRVLDAQYFGVAQRRRRVFVVGCLGDWRSAAEVLFEPESLRGDSPPSREKGQEVAGTIAARFGISRNNHEECVIASGKPTVGTLMANAGTKLWLGNQEALTGDYHILHPTGALGGEVSDTVTSKFAKGAELLQQGAKNGGNCVLQPIALAENTIGRQPQNGGNGDGFTVGGPMYTLNATGVHGVAQAIPLDLRNAGRDPEKYDSVNRQGVGVGEPGDPAHTVTTACVHGVAHPTVLMDQGGSVMSVMQDGTVGTLRRETHGHEPLVMAPTLTASNDPSRSPQSTEVTNQVAAVHAASMAVRRLTPVECERLQGFPDNYTNIPWRKQPESPDGPRYKALGNSMAVPVMAWIGKRIQQMENV